MLSPAPASAYPTKPARHRSKPKPRSRPTRHKSPTLRSPSNDHEFPPPISRHTPRLRNVALPTRNAVDHFPPTVVVADPVKNLRSLISAHPDSPRPHRS